MKKEYFDQMLFIMQDNPNAYLIFVGLGYPRLDEFLKEFPDRAINTEASEQAALDIAVGLAYSGKIPFVYSITPFLLWRGAETIRTYINHENLNVKLIGAGRDDDYSKEDGFSHDAYDAPTLLSACMPNIKQHYPTDSKYIKKLLEEMVKSRQPEFLSLTR